MKRPGPVVYLFGNPLSVLALAILTAYLIYVWWAMQGSGTLAFVALLTASYAFKASDQLTKFSRWKREWQAMEGSAPGASLRRFVPSWRVLGGVVGLGGGGFLLLAAPKTPDGNIASGVVVLAVLIGIVGILFRRSCQGRPRRGEAASRDVVVTVCVVMPRQKSALAYAYAALPEYCAALINW
ncbi:MAG: hypothetical protein WDM91_09985 [Rhizomicrobium sp.]